MIAQQSYEISTFNGPALQMGHESLQLNDQRSEKLAFESVQRV